MYVYMCVCVQSRACVRVVCGAYVYEYAWLSGCASRGYEGDVLMCR